MIRKLYVVVTTVITTLIMFPKVTEVTALQICSHLKTRLLRLSQNVGDCEVLKALVLGNLYVEARVLVAGPVGLVVQLEARVVLDALVQDAKVDVVQLEQLLVD